MNEFFNKQKARLILIVTLILFITCTREPTKSVFPDNQQFNPDPQITSVEPANGSLYGIGQITISGSNFSSKKEENFVVFGSDTAKIVSASESQLIVRTPKLLGDSIKIKVGVVGALLYSNVIYYSINQAVDEMGGYGVAGEDLYAITVDASENVYVFRSIRFVDIISPDSIDKSQVYGTPVI